MSRLSIITINLNNRSGLEKTIRSVLYQTFRDYEFIIIDGGSVDGSTDVLNENEDRIDYWVSEKDNGIYHAMNKGIRHAKGDYCLFLNSGDWLVNNSVLQDCFKITFHEDFVYGTQLIESDEEFKKDICLDLPYITFFSMKKSHLPHQSMFIKRILFETIGYYNEKNKIISDWEFLMKGLFVYGCSIKRIPVEICVYDTFGISSISDTIELQRKERRAFLENQFPLFLKDYDYFENFMNKWYIKYILTLRLFKKKILKLLKH